MLIEIDTREQQTPTHIDRLLDTYLFMHTRLAKGLEYVVKVLECDIKCERHCAEIKWGHDLVSSLNSKHFLKQLTKMRETITTAQLYLICAHATTYAITTTELARATTICQELNVKVLFAETPLKALEKFLLECEEQPAEILPSAVIVEGNKKLPVLVQQVSRIPGISVEFAFKFVREEWHCLAEMLGYCLLHDAYIPQQLYAYYQKNMHALQTAIEQNFYGQEIG